MSLSHAGYNFENAKHTIVTPIGTGDLRFQREKWFGVQGEAFIFDELGGNFLECEADLAYYPTYSALGAALSTVRSKSGKLSGTLSMTVGGDLTSFPNATFLGYEILKPGWQGCLGGNPWVAIVKLRWVQTGLG